MRRKHSGLALEPKHRAVDIWLPRKHTDVVGEIACGEIIRTVNDYVVVSDNSLRILSGQPALVQFNLDLRVDVVQSIARRFKFASANVLCSVKNLPLQIGKIDTIEVDQPKLSHTSCR